MIDQGAGGENGSSSLGRLAKTSPTVVFNVLQQLEALGLSVPSVLQQLGVNAAGLPAAAPAPSMPPAQTPGDKRPAS